MKQLFSGTSVFEAVTPSSRRTWIWALPILVLVFIFLGQLLAIVPAVESGLIQPDNIEKYPEILWMLFGAFSGLILINMLWVWFFERRSWSSIGLSLNKATAVRYVRGFAIGLSLAAIIVYSIRFLGGYEIESVTVWNISDLIPVLLLMLGFMVQSGAEEILFRGWLMSRLSERHGLVVGVIGNSLIFMVLHLIAIDFTTTTVTAITIFVLMTMLFSIFLSLMAIREKSIWGACAWHAAWNWFFITGFGLPTTGIALDVKPLFVNLKISDGAPTWLTGGGAGPEDSVVTLIVLTIGCVWIANSLRSGNRQPVIEVESDPAGKNR